MNHSKSSASDGAATDRSRIASDVIARSLGESAVLIRLSTNRIYELNATGARVWDLLVKGATQEEIVAALQQEFEGERGELAEAVENLVESLRAEGLM